MQKDTFLIVDGNSLMHRAYHAAELFVNLLFVMVTSIAFE